MLNLKPNHKVIRHYYQEIEHLRQSGIAHEGATAPIFASLLRHCAGQLPHLQLIEQYPLPRPKRRPLRVDGAIVDRFMLRLGVWEAKDNADDLPAEIIKKFAAGYPKDNILFQSPERLILWQNGRETFNADTRQPESLIEGLQQFFGYQPPAYAQWQEAVVGFKGKVQELGQALLAIMADERLKNAGFVAAFEGFFQLCRDAVNPNLSVRAVEEMLIQHLLTERIFRKVFNNQDFVAKNVIAREIEKVIAALTAHSFSREQFLRSLDHCYRAIEITAATIEDYREKQSFLNAVYEQFFQGFAVDVADTHGIVYTPQPLVDFMVRSAAELLQREFGRSLSDPDVHILDPFVGTGNFITRILREIDPVALKEKYADALHCNELLLLPYYIASLNIEHAYFEATGDYQPFAGLCLVDTFELAEDRQHAFGFLTAENTERVHRQKAAPIFVIIGNPPYNAGQVNENDNNKNRKYPVVDRWVAERYAAHSKATNKNALSDPYVKAFAWATERLRKQPQGLIAFVTNNGFLDGIAFDGMRKYLAEEFTSIYHINMKGNARTSGERRRQEGGNVFDDAIRVSVGITFLVKHNKSASQPVDIWIYSVDDYLKAGDKAKLLENVNHLFDFPMRKAKVDDLHTWLTEGLQADFDGFIPLGSKEQKANTQETQGVIFRIYSRGVATSRDTWVYNFNALALAANVQRMIETYNDHVLKWNSLAEKPKLDDFVSYDDKKISWGEGLKNFLSRGKKAEFDAAKIRVSLYRPFTRSNIYFDRMFNERVYVFPSIFPDVSSEKENRVIGLSAAGNNKQFHCLTTNNIPDLHLTGDSQCFPFYTYSEDGQNRRENISDWALSAFRDHYYDSDIDRWAIFHYVYGILHHPVYRQKYAANLRRELPRIPYAADFWAFCNAGKQLAALHVDYEQQPEYPLKRIYAPGQMQNWQTRKMRLNPDKTALIYNEWITLAGIPAEAYEYRLGNRSALDWVIEQYQIKTDPRSGIVNDPNRPDNPHYILRLIAQVIYVSVETVKIVNGLPNFA